MKIHHLLTLILILTVQSAMAAHIQKIKGKKSLIVLDGMALNEGDSVYAIDNESQKKTAILKITKVNGDKAIGEIVKGHTKINEDIQPKAGREEMPTTRKRSAPISNSTFALGGLFGVGFDSMKITIQGSLENLTQTGMGYSLLGAADYKLNDWFSIRGLAGVEQFNAKADSKVNAGVVYDTKLTYFSGIAWGRFIFATNLWLGGALGIQQPLSTSTNALDESSLGTSLVYAVGGGADIALGENMYIPIQVEYGLQPKSDSVAPSYYSVRAGLMIRY